MAARKWVKLVSLSHFFCAAGNPRHYLSSPSPAPLQVYKTLSDSVILDWYISLYDKDRMSSCTVTYSPADAAAGLNNATSEALEEGGGGDSVVLDFLPRRRTFLLQSLSPNTTYQFVMECADFAGRNYATKSITFQTGRCSKGQVFITDCWSV